MPLTPDPALVLRAAAREPAPLEPVVPLRGSRGPRRRRLEQALAHVVARITTRCGCASAGSRRVDVAAEYGPRPPDVRSCGSISRAGAAGACGCDREAAAAAPGALDIAARPAAARGALRLRSTEPGRLLLAIHHLAVDGVSWRILSRTSRPRTRASQAGSRGARRPRTTSFKRWSRGARRTTRRRPSRATHWPVADASTPVDGTLPTDARSRARTRRTARGPCRCRSTATETRDLLQQVPAAYGTQINDVLLAALARALAAWTGRGPRVELEGHGREDLFEAVDLSRTVGWFTTLYPGRARSRGRPGRRRRP